MAWVFMGKDVTISAIIMFAILEVENCDAAQDLSPWLEHTQLEYDNAGLENLFDWVLSWIPITHTINHHPSAALGPVGRHAQDVVVADVIHLGGPDVRVDVRMFLFEVVVIHYLSEHPMR